MNKDIASGLLLLALAGVYFWVAETIPNSKLDDAFGPRGLPVALAALLAFLALILTVRGAMALRAATALSAANKEPDGQPRDAHLKRALGFLAIGVAYIVVLPVVGYPVSIALLIVAAALYEGAPRTWRVPAAGAFGGLLFWLLFSKLLGVAPPPGALFSALPF